MTSRLRWWALVARDEADQVVQRVIAEARRCAEELREAINDQPPEDGR